MLSNKEMLNDKERALLNSRLYVPIVVRDLLETTDDVEDDVHYALHEVISDMQPDSALLAIALAAGQIAAFAAYRSASMKVLNMECERILQEYGLLWLQNAQNGPIDDFALFETLIHTSEDLEGLAELICHNAAFLRDTDPKAACLCDILQIQAEAHAVIAAEFIEAIEVQENAVCSDIRSVAAVLADNVIPFPAGTVTTD